MDLGLRDRVALVAASSKGLGRAIAEEFAREGADVVISARGEDTLMRARDDIAKKTGARVDAFAADMSTADGVRSLVRRALELHDRVDVLVTNAGGPPSGPFESHDWDEWQRAVDTQLRSAVELARGVLPGMRERKWGRIINITSITVKQPVEGLILSNSIRAAVTGFARTLANEVAADGITVNNMLPGYTQTDRVESLADAAAKREGRSREEVFAKIAADIPMRRLGEPREFAALAAFLASDRASYITAQNIAVDGGWIRGLI